MLKLSELEEKARRWIAAETSVSSMPIYLRKRLFGCSLSEQEAAAEIAEQSKQAQSESEKSEEGL